jgi:hypothetical protein
VPTLVLRGEDRVVPVEAGHGAIWGLYRPAEFARVVGNFLHPARVL